MPTEALKANTQQPMPYRGCSSTKTVCVIGMVVGGVLMVLGPILHFYMGIGGIATLASLIGGGAFLTLVSIALMIRSCTKKERSSHRAVPKPRENTLTEPKKEEPLSEQEQALLQKHQQSLDQKASSVQNGIDLQDSDGNTELHQAIVKGNALSEIEQLIQKGANLNIKNKEGNTPLHLTVINKHYPATSLLLKNEADPNIMNNKKKTPYNLLDKTNNPPLAATFQFLMRRSKLIN